MEKKFIVRNYTSRSEAIFLKDLGLPADTADMYYYDHEMSDRFNEIIIHAHYFSPDDLLTPFSKRMPFFVYPCWSAGQLLLINKLCNLNCESIEYGCNNDKAVMDVIMDVFKHSDFDFNILKEGGNEYENKTAQKATQAC